VLVPEYETTSVVVEGIVQVLIGPRFLSTYCVPNDQIMSEGLLPFHNIPIIYPVTIYSTFVPVAAAELATTSICTDV
jgi:hypothetical protein